MKEIKSVCVFCASSSRVPQEYKDAAYEMGKILAESDLHMIFGGGRLGLMGLTAEGALENGGQVTGVTTLHLHELEMAHAHLTELFVVDTMHQRKAMMEGLSDAFVLLPGGFGTLEELFEVLTWKQIGLIDKPIVFVNVGGFWDPLLAYINTLVTQNVIMKEHLGLFEVVDSPLDVMKALYAPKSTFDPRDKWREEGTIQ